LPAPKSANAPQLPSAGQSSASASRRPDFYVKPDGQAVHSTMYRYAHSALPRTQEIIETKVLPAREDGWYVTPAKFETASAARAGLQINPSWNDAAVRLQFDTLQVAGKLEVPRSLGGKGAAPEPITVSYPEYGPGGYPQYIIRNTDVYVDTVSLLGP
jgi:hypothetical protein